MKQQNNKGFSGWFSRTSKRSMSFLRRIKSRYLALTVTLIFSIGLILSYSNHLNDTTDKDVITAQSQDLATIFGNETEWISVDNMDVTLSSEMGLAELLYAPVKINLSQTRNGTGVSPIDPAHWQNGNAGGSNAHYVEGWAIPYRAIIENLPDGGTQSIDISWDIKHSDKHAIDFITYYDLLDYVPGTHATNFGHTSEVIDPTIGVVGVVGGPNYYNLTKPANLVGLNAGNTFDAILGDGLAKLTMWNGTITAINYISNGNLADASSSAVLRISFTNTSGPVILAWGGHIAKASDWGVGNSASALSGSPYHSSVEQWDPGDDGIDFVNVGNQDRSLSAAAVINPPPCDVTGPDGVCPGSTGHVYQNNLAPDPNVIPDGFIYEWSVTGNGTINGDDDGPKVTVDAGSTCNADYTVTLTIRTTNGTFVTSCNANFTVEDSTDPTATNPDPVSVQCSSDIPAVDVTVVDDEADNCSTPTVTHVSDVSDGLTCPETITRTYKVEDACGNSINVTQTITVDDDTNPTASNPDPVNVQCIGDVPAVDTSVVDDEADNCSTPTVTHVSDVSDNATCPETITRTYKVEDACGNSINVTQTITVDDDTNPTADPLGPINVSCSSQVPAANINAVQNEQDNCGTPTVTHEGDSSDGLSCPETITRTYKVQDACGNSILLNQTITVNDEEDPIISSCPADVTVECDASTDPSNTGEMTATDNCGDPNISKSDSSTMNGCQEIIVRTWTATDACGNTASCVQTIIVRDRTAPVIDCSGDGDPTVTDNCSATDDITLYYRDNGNTRRWTAIDESGNITNCDQDLTPQALESQVESSVIMEPDNIVLKAYPNPFENKVNFLIDIPEDTEGSLELVNMLGQHVQTIYSGKLEKGPNRFEAKLNQKQPRLLIYVLKAGGKKLTGKLIQSE